MLKVKNASFSYTPGGRLLFKDLSFSAEPGEILAVLGPNGIGKTTLLRCIMKFLPLSRGHVYIEGQDAEMMGQKEFWRHIAYVPQGRRLSFGYTAVNMVVMGLSSEIAFGRVPGKRDYERAHSAMERMGVEHLADQSCNTLSGGQLQMVLIARALVKDPKILILDEPETGLDLKNQIIVLNTIRHLADDMALSIVINTHYPDHALRVADKTLFIGENSYMLGKTREVVNIGSLRRFFGIESEILGFEHGNTQYQGIVPIDICL